MPAFCVWQTFGAEAAKSFSFDHHYLLYAARGTMRLEAHGRSWSLSPARAALIAARQPIRITIPVEIQGCSALFAPQSFAAPAAPLAVFDLSALARELILACRAYPADADVLPKDGFLMFRTLNMLANKLALDPSPAWIATPQSADLRRALLATEARLGDEAVSFDAIAASAGVTPRTLARRFSAELGMSWVQARQRLRMIAATEALAGGTVPITQIALQVGYSSPSAFNTAFRIFCGTTPTAYRAKAKSEV